MIRTHLPVRARRWFSQTEPELSPSVVPEYRRILDTRVLPKWGPVPLRRLRTADLDQWYAELRRNGALKGGPLAPNTVVRIHSVLRRALAQGVKWGWITSNPAANATLPGDTSSRCTCRARPT